MKLWSSSPPGKTPSLIWFKPSAFSRQALSRYKEPLKFPAGTKFEMEYTYDNSTDNPRNPSTPPQRIRRGEQTTDEMGITFLNLMPATLADAQQIRQALRDKLIGGSGATGGLAEILKRRPGSGAT